MKCFEALDNNVGVETLENVEVIEDLYLRGGKVKAGKRKTELAKVQRLNEWGREKTGENYSCTNETCFTGMHHQKRKKKKRMMGNHWVERLLPGMEEEWPIKA